MILDYKEIKELLDDRVYRYNSETYIERDPISIPHLFSDKEDIEIAAFLTATISWGQRISIINNSKKLMSMMDYAPADFIKHFTENDLKTFSTFRHRTFNGEDCIYFLRALKYIYTNTGGLEGLFSEGYYLNTILNDKSSRMRNTIHHFHDAFYDINHRPRTTKHVADPAKGSSAKRLNMFLRWLVRKDDNKVDFGIWDSIPQKDLMCPLDVHSGNVARRLGLLHVKQNNWKAVLELTENLRLMDAEDPVKYDFALFGLGVYEDY